MVKCNAKDSSGRYKKRDVPIPLPIFHYSKHMGGVDRSDQPIHYYNVLRQTRKYWKTLFFHFIDIAVVNSYILHTEKVWNPLTHYKFREMLVRSLSNNINVVTSDSDTPALADSSAMFESSSDTEDDVSFECHQFAPLNKLSSCIYCKLVHKKTCCTTKECKKCKLLFASKAETVFLDGTVPP